MNLTISELARAIGKSETYVRQHIHRKHLTPERRGRSVTIALTEAMRWARERELSFTTPAWISETAMGAGTQQKERVARVTVLSWNKPDSRPINLFTLVRHRRKDSLGPWGVHMDECWRKEDLRHDLCLYSFDTNLDRCQELVDQILNTGTLDSGGIEIDYTLHPVARCHWAYRDDRPFSDASVRSPFLKHSAEIIEYWNFNVALKNYWIDVLTNCQNDLQSALELLRFPLDKQIDRVGNLMIAGAIDAVTWELVAQRDQTLRFSADADFLPPNAYRATVWASYSGNEVIRQEIEIAQSHTVIGFSSEVDHIGFSVCRAKDGQCVDLWEVFLILEMSGTVTIDSSPIMRMKSPNNRYRHEVSQPATTSIFRVQSNAENAQVDKHIRQLWLERRLYTQEERVRKDKNFVRFQPHEFTQAAKYFVGLVSADSHRTEPIYLADPYFELYRKEKKQDYADLVQLYLELFVASTGRPLRILCGRKKCSGFQPWWVNYPAIPMNHVSVKTFRLAKNRKSGFHDRYLITSESEIVMTHSLNGWSKAGVTFIRLPYTVYRAEAERLWSMNLESDVGGMFVQEILRG